MFFATPLITGTLIKRYKRFLADVQLPNGDVVTAHCPNTGAMTGCAEPGYTAYLSQSNNPKRKLKYTWELAKTFDDHFIGINTQNANKAVAEALESKVFPPFTDVNSWKAEVTPSGGNSRFDFAVQTAKGCEYIEVKSVTLRRENQGFFPDAVTTRGTKHCEALANLSLQGVNTTLLFCVQHTGISCVKIATDIDPNYAAAVKRAHSAGVNIQAIGCKIDKENIVVNQHIPVFL